ncbi:YybH family protein [Sphingomonas baiyangensis]|uniref:Nuclear transport factor 2 family protein n=1 Tax=Sphingomonas baiyangensis TaxID=2572576 RepID=A0A4U1L379_9SPHN|nr:DUF4440 domain-containing protein [Sphingomonas baiyangensis]TKD50680.1 nuclear transport factor 2 family protein [Sphingomonas baiyangensis]
MILAAADDAETAIRATRLSWNAAIAEGDPDGAVRMLTADAILVPAGGTALVGIPAIRKAWRAAFRGDDRQTYVRTPLRIEARGNVAAETGRWSGGAIGSAPALSGQYLAEWVRSADQWRCRVECYVAAG